MTGKHTGFWERSQNGHIFPSPFFVFDILKIKKLVRKTSDVKRVHNKKKRVSEMSFKNQIIVFISAFT